VSYGLVGVVFLKRGLRGYENDEGSFVFLVVFWDSVRGWGRKV